MKKKKPSPQKAIPTETRFVEDLLAKFQIEIEQYAEIRNTLELMAGRVNTLMLTKPNGGPINDTSTIVGKLDDKVITLAHLNTSMREILGQLNNAI